MKNNIYFTRAAQMNSVTQKTKLHKELLADIQQENNTVLNIEKIAGLNENLSEVSKQILGSPIIFRGKGNNYNPNKQLQEQAEKQGMNFYKSLIDKDFFTAIRDLTNTTNSIETGSELISKTIKINDIHYNRTTKTGMIDYKKVSNSFHKLNDLIKNKTGYGITYDTETIGDNIITELSATAFSFKDNNSIHNVSSIIGIDDQQAKYLENQLKSIKSKLPKDYTNSEKITLRRLSIYGDPNLKVQKDGYKFMITSTSDEIETSISNAEKGLDFLKNIGKQQPIEEKEKIYKEFGDLVFNGKINNNQLDDYISIGQNNIGFDDKFFTRATGLNYDRIPDTNVDLYQVTKYINENISSNAHLPKGFIASNDYGLNTQDTLKQINPGAAGESIAHTAKEDENALYKILTSPVEGEKSYIDFINKKLNQVDKIMNNRYGIHNDNNVYYIEQTGMMPFGSTTNAINFTYNPLDKSFKTYDGYRINNDKSITKEGFNGFGAKKGTLVTSQVYEIDINSKEFNNILNSLNYNKNQIDAFYEQYRNVDKLYLVKSVPYIDKKAVTEKFGENAVQEYVQEYYSLYTNIDEVSPALNMKIGNIVDGELQLDNKAIDEMNFKKFKLNDNGSIELEKITDYEEIKNKLIDRTLYRNNVDSASSSIRKIQYSKLAQFRDYNMQNHISVSQRISQLVANNKDLNTDFVSELINDLGFNNYRTNSKTLYPETIMKSSIIDKYSEAINPFMEAFEKVISEKGLSGDSKTIAAKKDFMFDTLFNRFIEDIHNKDINKINNYHEGIFTDKELNVIDFNMRELFPERFNKIEPRKLSGINGEYISLNLNSNKSLMNFFIKNSPYKNIDPTDPNVQYNALVDAFHTLKEDERFSAALKDITEKDIEAYRNGGNLVQLNNMLTEKISNYVANKRMADPNFGYLFSRYVQDYSDVDIFKNIDYSNAEEFIRINIDSTLGDLNFISENNQENIDSFIDNYLMPISKDEYKKQIAHFGSKDQQLRMMQYNLARENAYNTASDLLKAINNTDSDLIINNNSLFLRNRSNGEISPLDLFRFESKDGILTYKIGGDNYSLYTAFDVNNIVSYTGNTIEGSGLNNLKVNTNLGNVTDRMYSMNNAVKNAIKNEEDPIQTIIDRIKYMNRTLREVGPRNERNTFNSTIYRSNWIDVNPIIRILPELESEGIIRNINNSYGIEDKYKNDMSKLISRIKNKRVMGINDLLPSEQNLLNSQYLIPILTEINDKVDFGSINGIDINAVINEMNLSVQNTKAVSGILSLSNSNYNTGAAKFDNSNRSVNTQEGNALTYNKKDIEKTLAKQIEENPDSYVNKFLSTVTVGNNIVDKANERFVNGEKYAQGLTYKYMQTTTEDLRDVFIKDDRNTFKQYLKLNDKYNNLSDEEISNIANKMYDKALGLSVYQQETLMNARLHYTAFYKENNKVINAQKELIAEHTKNLTTLKAIKQYGELGLIINKDGTISYGLGVPKISGDVLGLFGVDAQKVISKHNGIFRGRYFDKDGNIVPIEELNKLLKENNITGEKDIYNFLNSKYDYKYELIRKFETGRHKIYNAASEKSTVTSLDMGLGTIDKYVEEYLTKLGLQDDIGKVYSREYLEEYFIPKLKDSGKYSEDLIDRIFSERFAFSDALLRFKPFENVGQFSNLNDIKHESISLSLENMIYQIKQREDRNDFYKLLFGDKYKEKNGLLFLDDVDNIKFKFTDEELSVLNKEQKEFFETLMNKSIFINRDGEVKKLSNVSQNEINNVIGHIGYSTATHAFDDAGGTYSTESLDIYKIRKEISNNKRLIDKSEESDIISSLTKRNIDLERKLNFADIEKGLKFDERSNLILNRQVFDKDTISSLKNTLGENEFNRIYKYALGESGELSEKYLGAPILDPVTKVLRNKVLLGHNETPLSIAAAKDNSYSYLNKEFKNVNNMISAEKAEIAYSLQQGKRAIDFNYVEKNSLRSRDSLMANLTSNELEPYNRYKVLDFTNLKDGQKGWLDLDRGGLGNTIINAENNPYTNNILIKTGLNEKGYEYLAVARMPEKHFEDGLIKKSHISTLGQIQDTIKEINSGNFEGEELDKKVTYVKNRIDEFRERQKFDITSKDGLAGELYSTRLQSSANLKTSTLKFNYLDDNATIDDLIKANGENSVFSRGKINGKTWIENYKENKTYDIMEVGEDFFKNNGYFEEDFMDKIFSANTEYKDFVQLSKSEKIEQMKNILETNGEAVLATRYPRIKEGSDTIAYAFLNRDLKANEIKVLDVVQAKQNGDNDGDLSAISIIKDEKENSYLTNELSKTNSDFNKSIKADTTAVAALDNKYWEKVVAEETAKEKYVAINGNTINSIYGKKGFNGSIFSGELRLSEIKNIIDNNLVNEYKEIAEVHGKDGEQAAIDLMKQKYNGIDGNKTFQTAEKEYKNVLSYLNMRNEIVAKTSQASIGEVNISNFKTRTLLQTLVDTGDEGYNLSSRLMYRFMDKAEQAVISAPKKTTENIDPYRAKSWNEPMMNLIRGRGNAADNKKQMIEWAKKYTPLDKGDMNYLWSSSDEFKDIASSALGKKERIKTLDEFNSLLENKENLDKISNKMITRFVNNIGDLAETGKTRDINNVLNSLSIGVSSTGVSNALNISSTTNSPINTIRNDIDSIINSSKNLRNTENIELTNNVKNKGSRLFDDILTEDIKINNNTKRSIKEAVFEDTKSMLKSVKGNKIATGAIGIAAGIMMLGYAGARPRPAETQAMEENNEYEDNGSLADQGIAPMGAASSQNGYVININAKTSQGKENAINAIQQALSSGMNSSINMSYNINDDYGNISDRDIEKAISNLL